MKKRFWLSYDLGIDGDYDSLYAWLDGLHAVECGDSVASFELECGDKDPLDSLQRELKKSKVRLRSKDRLYAVWRKRDGTTFGRFIVGKRKRAPWAGYAFASGGESESDE